MKTVIISEYDEDGRRRICASWSQLINSKKGYEAFVEFLSKELNTQYLLFATEYGQFIKILNQHEVFTKKFTEQNVGLPEQWLRFGLRETSITNKLEQKLNKSYYIEVANDSRLKKVQLGIMSQYIRTYKGRVAASIMYQKYLDASLHDIMATNHFIEAANQLYEKYMCENAVLSMNITLGRENALGGLFEKGNSLKGNSPEQQKELIEDICVETMRKFQRIFEKEIDVILSKSFKRFMRTDKAVQLRQMIKRRGSSIIIDSWKISAAEPQPKICPNVKHKHKDIETDFTITPITDTISKPLSEDLEITITPLTDTPITDTPSPLYKIQNHDMDVVQRKHITIEMPARQNQTKKKGSDEFSITPPPTYLSEYPSV